MHIQNFNKINLITFDYVDFHNFNIEVVFILKIKIKILIKINENNLNDFI